MSTDEKKPPEGGRKLNHALLHRRHQVLGRLIAARESLNQASHLCWMAGLHPCGDAVDEFVERELEQLLQRAITLLEEAPASRARPAGSNG